MEVAPFEERWSGEVARWATSAAEARAWAGRRAGYPVSAAAVRGWRLAPGVRAYGGEEGGEPVAYGELWVDREADEVELARIIVRPGRRGCGTGRAFVAALVKEAAETGLAEVFVRVAPGHEAALRCYAAAGFRRVSEAERRRFNEGQPEAYEWLRHAG